MNNNLKKHLYKCLMFLITIFILVGCTTDTNNKINDDEKLNIITTIFPAYDFVREITQDSTNLSLLIPLGAEMHHYEPTPQDLINIQNCDVFIYVGGISDYWIDDLLKSLDTSSITIIKLIDLVQVLEEEIIEGMEVEHDDSHDHHHEDHNHDDHHHHDIEYDEHIWTSIKNTMIINQEICRILATLDSYNAKFYYSNLADYIEELEILDSSFQEVINNAARKTLLFGDRFPFRYFIEDYNLNYYAAFPGCSTLTEASSATIAFLIDKVNEENIPVVFHLEFSNQNIVDIIVESTNAKKLQFHSAHTISKAEFDQGVTYLSIMYQNLEAIKEALS